MKGEENCVADALSRKLHCVYGIFYNQLEWKFLDQVKEEAWKDPEYQFLWQQMEEARKQRNTSEYGVSKEQMITFKGKLYIQNRVDLKELIMNEYHQSNYVGHPGYQKMLIVIRKIYFWPGMWRDIVEYLNKFLECQ